MKLKINKITGIVNIVGAILITISWFAVTSLLPHVSITTSYTNAGKVAAMYLIFDILLSIGLTFNIISLIQSTKNNISITGPILGIIGYILFGLTLSILAFPAFILVTLAAVFTLKQRPAKTK